MNYLFLLSYGGLSFCKKKSRLVFLLGFALLWMVFAFNYSNPDYASYERQYQQGENLFFTEPLITTMMSICRRLHLGYKEFLAIEAFLGLLMICYAIYTLSPYPNPVIFLYSVFPFYLDITQTRSFMAEAFLLIGIVAVVRFSEKKSIAGFIFSIIMMICAIGCHYSAVLYFPLLVLLFYSEKKNHFFFWVIPAAYMIVPLFFSYLMPLAASVIGGRKTFLWLSKMKSPTIAHLARMIIIRLGFVVLILLIRKYLERITTYEKQNNILLLAYIYVSLNVVFELFLNSAFERTTRPALIIGNILLSRYIHQTDNEDNKKALWIFMVAHNVLYLLSTLYFYKSGDLPWFDFVFRSVFENSLIWR